MHCVYGFETGAAEEGRFADDGEEAADAVGDCGCGLGEGIGLCCCCEWFVTEIAEATLGDGDGASVGRCGEWEWAWEVGGGVVGRWWGGCG